MTEHDYMIAWGLYAFAALGCLLVWFRLTRWLWRWLREPLRLAGAVLLLSPTIIDPAKALYAPAVAIAALETLFGDWKKAISAFSDLAMYLSIGIGLYLLFVLIRWPIERARKAREPVATAAGEPEDDEPFAAADQRERLEPRPPLAGTGRTRVEPRL